ncbi:MAG TPA: polysaccharide biosynthesis/export family protein [Bryobacteraceae bacterium]|nr:polysaccharide biosynthesis/export family protein [Bryobacteraceae bacterium]
MASKRSLIGAVLLSASLCLFTPLRAQNIPQGASLVNGAANIPDALKATPSPLPVGYVIGPGDILQIDVRKEPDVSVPSVVVRPDGIISVPLIKDVNASGLTPHELEANITEKLAKLIREPDVTIVIKEIHSAKVFVIGAVKQEGALTLQGPLSVLQAIAEAGGLTDYAKRNKIFIMRDDHGKALRLPFEYDAVIRGLHPDQNVMLRPGDSLIVPQ